MIGEIMTHLTIFREKIDFEINPSLVLFKLAGCCFRIGI